MGTGAALLWHQYRLERRLFWRNPSAAFFNFAPSAAVPGLLRDPVPRRSQKELNVLVPGIAGMAVMSAHVRGARSRTWSRCASRACSSACAAPRCRVAIYLGGLALNALANTVIQLAFVLVAGNLIFGIDGVKNGLELSVFLVIGVVCFASIGVAFAHAIPNSESAPAYINAVFLPVIFISGVFYDAANAPSFIRDIAEIFPLVHLIDGLTGALVNGSSLADNAGDLAVLAVWSVGGIVLAVRGFSWEARG